MYAKQAHEGLPRRSGREVFLSNVAEVLANKRKICEAAGWIGLSPVDNEIPHDLTTPTEVANAIYHGNLKMMDQADAIIANITPFRGSAYGSRHCL